MTPDFDEVNDVIFLLITLFLIAVKIVKMHQNRERILHLLHILKSDDFRPQNELEWTLRNNHYSWFKWVYAAIRKSCNK